MKKITHFVNGEALSEHSFISPIDTWPINNIDSLKLILNRSVTQD